jgi:transcriptional regulator NrdR family protein
MTMPIAVNGDRPKTFRRSRLCFQRFRLAIAWRSVRDERLEQMMSGMRNLINRSIECVFVCLRRFSETAQLADELKRRRPNLVVRRGRSKIIQGLNVSAHKESLTADAVVSKVESITQMKTDLFGTLTSMITHFGR